MENVDLNAPKPYYVKYGYYFVFLSILFFQVLNKGVQILGPPKSIKNTPTDFWKYRNILISWIHASIVAPWTLGCSLLIPAYWRDGIIHIEPFGYGLLTFSTGYFIYDFCDIIVNKKVGLKWAVCVHHIAVTSIFVYNVTYSNCVGYCVYSLLTEVNSVPLHTRKILQMRKVDFNHWFCRLNCWVNMISFAIFRPLALSIITYGMALESHITYFFSYGFQIYYYMLCFSMTIMWLINPLFFWQLLKSDFLCKRESKKAMNGNMSNGINNNDVKKVE